MLKSMTGFGRASITSKTGSINVEISGVNKRFLDISLSIPKDLSILEIDIKKLIKSKISRGSINIKIDFASAGEDGFLPDKTILKKLKKSWEVLAKDLGYPKEDISFEFLFEQYRYMPQKKQQNLTDIKKLVLSAVSKALVSMIEMRSNEAEEIKKDLENRISDILKYLAVVEKNAPNAKILYENKLVKRLNDLLQQSVDKDSIMKEAAVFAEKIDIQEEIVRLKSHVKQFLLLLKSKKEAVGRKLEFLLQEFLRETNTISSKSADIEISKSVVEIKDEIEKIKEQLQNIE
jgi:uncharacterized protein (TIGR00255 family)